MGHLSRVSCGDVGGGRLNTNKRKFRDQTNQLSINHQEKSHVRYRNRKQVPRDERRCPKTRDATNQGNNDVAAVFRSTAEGETGHAHGHLGCLRFLVIPFLIIRSNNVEHFLPKGDDSDA